MRSPRSPAWAHAAAFVAALSFAVAGFVPGAAAQEKFKQLFVFGDSYADLTLSDTPASNFHAPPGVAFSLWRVYPIPLQQNLGIPGILDFAVGGATTVSLKGQVDAFVSTGTLLGPRDLVTLSIGGNDGIGFALGGGKISDAPLAGELAAGNAVTQIRRLIDAGGETYVLAGFSGLSGLPLIPPGPLKDVSDAFGKAYFDAMQTNLLPDAQKGVRFFLLDLHRLGQQIEANTSQYGLSGVICPGFPAPIGSVCGKKIDSPLQNQYFIGPDGLHLTNRGFEIAAQYMANMVMAPDTIAVQPGIVTTTTGGFVSSLFTRLGGARQAMEISGNPPSAADDGAMGLGHKQPPRDGPPSRLVAYTMGTILGGNRSEAPDVVGFEYDSTSGTAGIEYAVNRNLIVGLAGNYTTTHADLTSGANIDLEAIQAAAYLSYATKQLFADVVAAFGAHDVGLVRPGMIDWVRSSTDASTFALAARGGYLFDFGGVRAGPIAGLTYIRTRVDAYTEKGDQLLTFNVSSQTLDSLTGNVGVRFLAPFQAGGNIVVPYLNVMLEHQFGDATRTLTVDQVQTTLFLPIMTSIPSFDTRTYGKVEGGITIQLGPDFSASISGASTFARDEGNDFRVSTGLNFRF